MNDEFAPPPFDPASALTRLSRELRALGLEAREGGFERRGQPVARVALDADGRLAARLVRKLARTPEWQQRTLRNAAEVRDFLADVKRRLAAASDRDD